MATASWSSNVLTSSTSGSSYTHVTFDEFDRQVRERIPKYSTISSFTATFYVRETTNKIGVADFYVFFGDSSAISYKQLYYGNGVIPKNNGNYLAVPIDLKSYINSNGASAGQIIPYNSQTTRLYTRCQSSLVSRTYERYYTMNVGYTPPTFTIKVTAGTGGTVSGGGTFDVTVADQTKQITATANSGYKFVKWTDSSGNTYSTNATANVTISEDSISSSSTTASYTAHFEKLHTHSYTTETSRTPSTCYTKGSVTKKCSCGETQTTELALDPNNHAGGTEVKNAKAATCTATGYTGDTYCKGCGVKISSGTTIAKKAHTETTISAVAPTCTATGLTAGKKCSVCGTVTVAQQAVPALGHNYSSQVITPTVNADGYTLHTCQNGCGSSYKDNYTVNKICIGTSQPKAIYIGTQEVKAVYVGTTKVYG